MLTRISGITSVEASDNATLDNFNRNDALLDEKIQDLDASTSAVAPGKLIRRDANGRAKVANPAVSDDIANKGTVEAAIAALLDGAPGSLDTLRELAAAMGNDPNFATTVSNALALKMNANAYTAADVLAKIKTVDGAGSGLDADILDGRDGNSYAHTAPASAAELSNNTTLTSGMYSTNQASTMGLPWTWAHIINLRHWDGTGYNAQIATPLDSASGAMYIRHAIAGAWQPWKKIYTASSITASPLLPSGGTDGDIWIVYTP